ncbi:MAG: hypothetical protein NZ602_04840 [Thermoguttaceae bacterium]|nr:hypothetical protein [Thermoguttaceae bacterium]
MISIACDFHGLLLAVGRRMVVRWLSVLGSPEHCRRYDYLLEPNASFKEDVFILFWHVLPLTEYMRLPALLAPNR